MLPPLRLGLTQPTIATDAAAGWMVHPYRTIKQHGSPLDTQQLTCF
jgi:hypothetical protein